MDLVFFTAAPSLLSRTTEGGNPKNDIKAIFAGTAPYQGLDVLYDSDQEQIGVKTPSCNRECPCSGRDNLSSNRLTGC